MREFRGKTIKKENREHAFNNVWVYGDLVVSRDKYYIHPRANAFQVNNELSKLIVLHEVIPETVGQCIGIQDKNKKWIFEGDILECKRIDDGITVRVLICIGKYVDYNSDDKNIGVYVLLNEGATIGVNDICEHQDMFEVIGNLHDNIELLRGEEMFATEKQTKAKLNELKGE